MNASHGKLIAEVHGEVEKEDGVLVLRRIHVVYDLEAQPEQQETAQRAHDIHKRFCPVYRSIEASIDVTTELRFRSDS